MSGSRAGRVDDREVPPDTPGRFGLREPAERRAGGNVPASLTLTTPAPGSAAADETAIASGRRVILAEVGGAEHAGHGDRRQLRRRGGAAGRGRRSGRGHRHGQERARGVQDRCHPGLDRHARPLRPSGRGQPRRSRHDHAAGRGAGPVELRRDERAARPDPLHAPLLDPADRRWSGGRPARWPRPPT